MSTSPLPDSDRRCLLAAEGWLELGSHMEAFAEIQHISREFQLHPQVVDLQYQIFSNLKRWTVAYDLAQTLVGALPRDPGGWIKLAYAARRKEAGGILDAREILIRVVDDFPAEPLIRYNLACYACQLGEKESALNWLRQAIACGRKADIKFMARKDEDLVPLRSEIERL